MNSIQALLEALKRHETDAKGHADFDDDKGEPIAAKVSVMRAVPVGESKDDEPDSDMEALDAMRAMTDDGDDAPPDDEPESGVDPAQHGAVVGKLAQDYPQILDKIMKAIG